MKMALLILNYLSMKNNYSTIWIYDIMVIVCSILFLDNQMLCMNNKFKNSTYVFPFFKTCYSIQIAYDIMYTIHYILIWVNYPSL